MDELSSTNSYLIFKIEDEYYALHVNKVLSILEYEKTTKIPNAPKYIKGIINLRGTVLPIIDTRLKLNMPETQITKNTCIIILEIKPENETVKIGILVDAVIEVSEHDDNQMLAPPQIGSKYKAELVEKIIYKDETLIMLLDINKLFSFNDIQKIAQVGNVDL